MPSIVAGETRYSRVFCSSSSPWCCRYSREATSRPLWTIEILWFYEISRGAMGERRRRVVRDRAMIGGVPGVYVARLMRDSGPGAAGRFVARSRKLTLNRTWKH